MRMSRPRAFALSRLICPEAGTRKVSPKLHRITFGCEAISMALSMRPTGSTQTGQPGPWIMRTLRGSRSGSP